MKEIPRTVRQNEDAHSQCLAVGGHLNSLGKKLREVSLF